MFQKRASTKLDNHLRIEQENQTLRFNEFSYLGKNAAQLVFGIDGCDRHRAIVGDAEQVLAMYSVVCSKPHYSNVDGCTRHPSQQKAPDHGLVEACFTMPVCFINENDQHFPGVRH